MPREHSSDYDSRGARSESDKEDTDDERYYALEDEDDEDEELDEYVGEYFSREEDFHYGQHHDDYFDSSD